MMYLIMTRVWCVFSVYISFSSVYGTCRISQYAFVRTYVTLRVLCNVYMPLFGVYTTTPELFSTLLFFSERKLDIYASCLSVLRRYTRQRSCSFFSSSCIQPCLVF